MSLDPLRQYYLQQMGINTWFLRGTKSLLVIGEKEFTPKETVLLYSMLKTIGLNATDVHVITPEDAQLKSVMSEINQQIIKIKPKIILAMGQKLDLLLLEKKVDISTSINSKYDHSGVPVIFTYHPSHLLQCRLDKKNAYLTLLYLHQML